MTDSHFRNFLTTGFLIAMTLLIAVPAQGQEIRFETKNWEKLKQKAAKKDKILFVDAYTTWCGPCKWMSANVFTDPAVAEFYNENFINVKLDMEAGEGIDFAKEYGVNAYPTLLFIDGNGEVVHKRLGAARVDAFVALGEVALTPDKRLSHFVTEFENGNREPEFLKEYVQTMGAAGINPKEAADLYFSQLSGDELATSENYEMLRTMYPPPSIGDQAFQAALKHREAFIENLGDEGIDDFLKEICEYDILRAISKDDHDAYAQTISAIENMDAPFREEVLLYGKMKKAWAAGDYPGFIQYTDSYSKSYSWDDWNSLNSMAWDIYEDDDNYSVEYVDLGVRMARRSVEIMENPYNTDTLAALLYKKGDYSESLSWAEKAVQLAEEAEMDPSSTKELITKINSALNTN